MNNETFRTLAEALALECSTDAEKHKVFSDVFYNAYNKGLSLLHVDSSLSGDKSIVLIHHGKTSRAFITAYDWSVDDRYSSGHARGGSYRVKLELVTDDF